MFWKQNSSDEQNKCKLEERRMKALYEFYERKNIVRPRLFHIWEKYDRSYPKKEKKISKIGEPL